MSLRYGRSSTSQKESELAGAAGAAGAADAVDVELGHVRQIEVDDVREAVDVDAARGDVGRDQHAQLGVFEALERALAGALGFVAVDRGGGDAGLVQVLGDAVGAVLGAREDQRALDLRGLSRATRAGGACRPSRRSTSDCSTISAVDATGVTATSTGSCSSDIESARMLGGIVAENSSVWRFFGTCAAMRLTSWMKPMSSMRSASSSTNTFTSGERHGAAAHQVEQAAGRGDQHVDAARERVDLALDVDAAERDRAADAGVAAVGGEARRRSASASSRVGASTSTRSLRRPRPRSCCSRRSRIGSANAAVLPVPVCAQPSRSRPASTCGIAFTWIGVGVL